MVQLCGEESIAIVGDKEGCDERVIKGIVMVE
jgi:hypothetical protein